MLERPLEILAVLRFTGAMRDENKYLFSPRSRALGQEPDADIDKPQHRQKCRHFCDDSQHAYQPSGYQEPKADEHPGHEGLKALMCSSISRADDMTVTWNAQKF